VKCHQDEGQEPLVVMEVGSALDSFLQARDSPLVFLYSFKMAPSKTRSCTKNAIMQLVLSIEGALSHLCFCSQVLSSRHVPVQKIALVGLSNCVCSRFLVPAASYRVKSIYLANLLAEHAVQD
jgi:hypothetical protein